MAGSNDNGRPSATFALRWCAWRFAVVICVVWFAAGAHRTQAAGVVGTGSPASCTEAALNTALTGGGLVTFDCGAEPVTITLTAEKVITSEATVDGGGVVALSGGNAVRVFSVSEGAALTVENLTIANGSSVGGDGGGIWNDGTAAVTNSTLSGNGASDDGGAIWNGGTLTVTNSTFSDNRGRDGGGIFNGGSLTVTNSTFHDNGATIGGGIFNSTDGTLTVTNSTFSGNRHGSESGGGGAIATLGAVTVTNTIIANSIACYRSCSRGNNCANFDFGEGTIADGGHNIDDDGTCGFTGIGCTSATGSSFCTNPQLDTAGLANNGGPTRTIALEPDSPAINAGDSEVCANPPVSGLDQRGFVRPGIGHTQCSIGAHEADAMPPEPCTGDCEADGSVTVDEIITLVNIALDNAQFHACPHGVPSAAEVDVAFIIQAVNAALGGCGG